MFDITDFFDVVFHRHHCYISDTWTRHGMRRKWRSGVAGLEGVYSELRVETTRELLEPDQIIDILLRDPVMTRVLFPSASAWGDINSRRALGVTR